MHTYQRWHFYVHEKIVQNCQNSPLSKFMRVLFITSCVSYTVTYGTINIYVTSTNWLTYIRNCVNKLVHKNVTLQYFIHTHTVVLWPQRVHCQCGWCGHPQTARRNKDLWNRERRQILPGQSSFIFRECTHIRTYVCELNNLKYESLGHFALIYFFWPSIYSTIY